MTYLLSLFHVPSEGCDQSVCSELMLSLEVLAGDPRAPPVPLQSVETLSS